MRVILDFLEDAWDFVIDNAKWAAAGAGGLIVVVVVIVIAARGCGPRGDDVEEEVGRTEEEKSKDITLDLGGGVKMDFVWVTAIDGWMGKHEVSNAQFRKFRPEHDSGKYSDFDLNSDSQPVVFVGYQDAKEFAKWLNSNTNMPDGYTVRVPGRMEWLGVAQCGDGRQFPWGHKWPPPEKWNYHWEDGAGDWSKMDGSADGFPVTCPIEKSGENAWGVFGMGGNVLEWTDEFDVTSRGGQVLRGASWGHFSIDTLNCERAFTSQRAAKTHDIGFRVCIVR